jgi:hypothetical protein
MVPVWRHPSQVFPTVASGGVKNALQPLISILLHAMLLACLVSHTLLPLLLLLLLALFFFHVPVT